MNRIVMTLLAAFALVQPAVAAPDFGDHKSETLTSKAWKAHGSGNAEDTLAYVDKCIELYAAEAKKMQEALKELPANEPKEETFKRWALNDVGTCLFIKGEVLLKKGDKKGAKEAFARLVAEFKFAQCWDEKGWFWKPADAAKQKLVELEFDEKK
ncbi:MAG: beta-glucanase precursor [Kiritimatiellaeota bacterium]|nr:beta-glucanase precursor [Kiritimatiellota bacterium]